MNKNRFAVSAGLAGVTYGVTSQIYSTAQVSFGSFQLPSEVVQILFTIAAALLPLFASKLGPTLTAILQRLIDAFRPQFQSETFASKQEKLRAAMFLQDQCADCPKGHKACEDLLDSIVHDADAEPVDEKKSANRK